MYNLVFISVQVALGLEHGQTCARADMLKSCMTRRTGTDKG